MLEAKPTDAAVKAATTDASLACAETLLANGKKAEALAIYKGFASGDQPKHVRLAATRHAGLPQSIAAGMTCNSIE